MPDTPDVDALEGKYVVRIVPTRYSENEQQEPCVVLASDPNEVVCIGETHQAAKMVCDALNTLADLARKATTPPDTPDVDALVWEYSYTDGRCDYCGCAEEGQHHSHECYTVHHGDPDGIYCNRWATRKAQQPAQKADTLLGQLPPGLVKNIYSRVARLAQQPAQEGYDWRETLYRLRHRIGPRSGAEIDADRLAAHIEALTARADEAQAMCAALKLRNEELQRMVDAGLERSSEAAREAVKPCDFPPDGEIPTTAK